MWPALLLKLFGSAVQGVSALERGNAIKTIDGLNAENANAAAGQALQKGAFDELRATMRGDAVIADQRVMESGAGADINVGGTQATQRASQAVLDVTRRAIQVDAALTAYNLKQKAQGFYQEGEYAQREGRNEFIGSFLGGLGGLTDLNLPSGGGSAPTDSAAAADAGQYDAAHIAGSGV